MQLTSCEKEDDKMDFYVNKNFKKTGSLFAHSFQAVYIHLEFIWGINVCNLQLVVFE